MHAHVLFSVTMASSVTPRHNGPTVVVTACRRRATNASTRSSSGMIPSRKVVMT